MSSTPVVSMDGDTESPDEPESPDANPGEDTDDGDSGSLATKFDGVETADVAEGTRGALRRVAATLSPRVIYGAGVLSGATLTVAFLAVYLVVLG